MGLLEKCEVVQATTVFAGSTTILSDIIDMSGAEGCLFLVHGSSLFTVGSTGVKARFRVLGSTADSTASMIHLRQAGTTAASTAGHIVSSDVGAANTRDKKAGAIDVYKPTKRYVMLAIDKSSDALEIIGLKYGLKRQGSTEARDSSTLFGTTTIAGACTS